jgi:DNA-binding NarL/FixJ family response regulator
VAARLHAIRARATGDGHDLLAAAERHAAARLCGDALELAGLAAAALGRDTTGARARALVLADEMRAHLRIATPRFEPVVGLSRRELEVARLAARGMTDRDIAHTLVLSVRTVESHLAAVYRKLGIGSRHQLADVLAEVR